MNDPCDEWPALNIGGEWVIAERFFAEYRTGMIAGYRVIYGGQRCGKSAMLSDLEIAGRNFGYSLREYAQRMGRLVRAIEPKTFLDELPNLETRQRAAKGYRQHEFGGKRWGRPK